MQQFLGYITAITELSEKAQKAIAEKMVRKQYAKNCIVVDDLCLCDKLYFVEQGLLRIFYHNDSKEITDFFADKHATVGPVLRFQPIRNFIHSVETLEETTVLYIHLADLEQLYVQYPELERLGRLLALQTMFQLQHRIDSIQFFSAKERYDDFANRHATLLQRVALGHIASYLGMNQVTLSRVRRTKN
ncbi:MAG: Crp/Fnr family transcriptional regulator [Cytophagales bacterium]|nr:MAG: Crp/Fnr family transcriptional regulator [Cytophagales bacterium]